MFATIVAAIREWATAWGGLGLLVLGALDSSFLSFPQVNDILVIYLSINNPGRWLYYAGMSALGSLLGCSALYYLGRKGGGAFMRKRFSAGHVERVMRIYQKYGVLAVIVPALLPPPTPFKLFVLLAGAGGVSPTRFAVAIVIGRGLRYFGQGWLAVTYGEQALAMVRDRSAGAGLALAAAIVLAALVVYVVRGRKGQQDGAAA